ncbi:BatA domain-containing protein [Pedobacter xixiisoli]|uniref:N-terminal double-transmembrane domain-containing protein n=1 Tax=Pedobacter xixiisoli TaxID=1476464 RepID=A0A285ZWU1_9SPHI|nr:BatA domain-containing protein [Pedobacter xixiisoli]SOD14122.1 N-terminal double-transmembrane domain-containing protein [Pedobacter xixiisoli]
MNFLYPGFLFALLAVLIPVIIHLFNFRKFKKVYFSNVSFLKEVKEQNSSREKLKNLLILAARILAIVFLVLAFARPFINSNSETNKSTGNIVSIYLDNSYSMDAVNKEGSLLDEAKRRAKEIVKSYQLNDRFQLLTNDFEGKHQRLLNSDEFVRAVDEVKISAANRNLQQVVNRQQGVFTGTANRFAYVISDFQQNFAGNEAIKKEQSTQLALVKLSANELPNISVDSVWFLSPVHQPNTSEKIIVRLKNFGSEEAKNIPLKLIVNNQQKAIGSITVAAGATAIDTLSYSGLSLGWQKGVLSIKDFPLTFDDELNFSFNVNANQQILSINGNSTAKYIEALFNADSYFKLTSVSENNINYAAFSNYSLIVVNGISQPSSGLAQELKNYVANGGTVVIFPSTTADLSSYNSFLTTLNLPSVAGLVTESTKVSQIELKHSLFKDVFETLPKNMDLPLANRYFTYAESSKLAKEPILQLPAGKTFIARYPTASGQFFLAATGLEEKDGNLSKHPLFVPLMYKIAFESAKDQPLFYTISKDNVITLPSVKLGANQSLKLIGDGFEVIPDINHQNGKTLLYVADQIQKSGFYNVRKADSTFAVVAFNDNRTESNMKYDSQAELEERFGSQKIHFIDVKKENVLSAIAEKNNGTELWKLCLILSLIFIAAEILLVRFFSPQMHK